MALLTVIDVLMMVVGGIGIIYQAICVIMSLFSKPVHFPDAPMDKRYAVLISARNEENVIGNLIDSLHNQTYPSKLIDIWLVADNCTDRTAEVVREMGCHVVERHDTELIGKGYALSYLLSTMIDSGVADDYDAYFVFDADNRLDRHYVEEMNKAFQSGFRILTSYRNSVNLADNWVSSGSALWFIRESRFLNNSRMILGSSCHVGGTGFMFSGSKCPIWANSRTERIKSSRLNNIPGLVRNSRRTISSYKRSLPLMIIRLIVACGPSWIRISNEIESFATSTSTGSALKNK